MVEEKVTLKEKLRSVENAIREELAKIEALKSDLSNRYRRRDKGKYEAERSVITGNLKNYEAEMVEIRKKISELEAQNV